MTGYKSIVYFCNWAIYGRKHFPADIPVDKLTHIFYAFANVSASTGEVILTDKWADTDIVLPGDSWNDPNTYLRGCFNQFFQFKKKHRNLKIILSIGGWTFSTNMAGGTEDEAKRRKFAESAVELVKNLGLDGLDIDWEYPENEVQAHNYVLLLAEVRKHLDLYANSVGLPTNKFYLSVAAPAGPVQYSILKIKEMDRYLSFWNLMCYDFAGSWSPVTAYHSNLYGGQLSADQAVKHYISAGVNHSKIVLGMPLYGRSFTNTKGLGTSFEGVGEGSFEAGVWDYKTLPLAGAVEQVDNRSVSASCYDSSKQLLITYDTPETVKQKASYIMQNGLAGGMWWESSADVAIGNPRSLIGAYSQSVSSKYEKVNNTLKYPQSKYENVRATHE